MKNSFFALCFVLLCSGIILQGVDSTPVVSRVYGDSFTSETPPTQKNGDIGVLDSTLNGTGSISVDAQLPGGIAQAIQVLSDGTYLVAMSKLATNSNVGKYNAEGTLVASFGTLGRADLGSATESARTMLVDVQGRILVAGGGVTGTAGWLKRLNSNGSSYTSFTTGLNWGAIYALGQQSSGDIIAAGFNGTNGQISRYNLDGTLDTVFGTATTPGLIILNGGLSGLLTLPTVTNQLVSVVIDANNLIYIGYSDASGGGANIARFTAVGLLDGTFGMSGIVNISSLNADSTDPIYVAIDLNNNLVAARQVGSDVKVTSIASTGQAAAPTFTDCTITSSGNVITMNNLITTSDGTNGKIYINGSIAVGVGPTIPYSRVSRLTNRGLLDTTFNPYATPGYNQFRTGTPDTTATLGGSGLSPDGQLYVVGYQKNGGIDTGYVSRLYNNINSYQIPQSPSTQEQGNMDLLFGSTVAETNPGVVTPFNGLYRGALQQKAQDVIELASGNLLVATDGSSNTQSQSNMTLIRLLPSGVLDGSFHSGGIYSLPNVTGTNEYITSIFQDGSTDIYVTGYSDNGAIFRKYDATGALLWNADISEVGFKALGVGLEGSNRVLLFLQATASTGQINAYNVTTGATDTTFNAASDHPGYLFSTDYQASPSTILHMGPVYGGVVAGSGNFFIAYINSDNQKVDVAQVLNAASGLASEFGLDGIVQNLFPSLTVASANAHIAFDKNFNCIVVGSQGQTMNVALLNANDGSLNTDFNNGQILSITVPNTTAVMLNQVTGVSDGSLIITGYDHGADETMLVIRVTAAGSLDTTFNSQGTTPGILTIQVGNQIDSFNARVATGLTIQSHTGLNQGNLIVSGYEKQFATDATPMVMRVFGQPGTTQVKSSPVVVTVPGDFDTSYNSTGTATTYADGASSPTAHQQVKVIREMVGTNIMTVISDGINSWTTQLLTNSVVDTSYGSAGSVAIVKGNGDSVTESVDTMVFDGSGNMLVCGTNQLLGGYVKRLLITGAMDTTFGGYTGNPDTVSYPAGTAYGVMSQVHAVAQLSNGNIVAVGNQNGVGTIVMLSNTGAQLSTFGCSGSVTNGINITSVSADSSNNIYVSVGYVDGVDKVRVVKLDASGQLVTSYGVGGTVDGVISDIDNNTSIRLVLDKVGKVVVAASYGGSTGRIAMVRLTNEGTVDTTFHDGTQLDIVFTISTTVQVTSLVALQNGKTLVAGYQYDSTVDDNHDFEFVACVDAQGNRDGAFGSGSPAGVVTFQIATDAQLSRYLWDMNIQTNGGILFCGAESPAVEQETPFTGRLYGFPDIQAVPQFAGYVPTPAITNILDPFFNETGITTTGTISLLSDGGSVFVDSLGRPIIGGYTSDNKFVVARFTTGGVLDESFGSDGIAYSSVIPRLVSGQYVAVDATNRIYIGGLSSDMQFIIARFTTAGLLDTTFSDDGIAQSAVCPNLSKGGYVTIDSAGRSVLGGITSDGKFVVARFTTNGLIDNDFGSGGTAFTPVASLIDGGSVATNSDDQVYIGGRTSTETLVVTMFTSSGVLNSSFGTAGIAYTSTITGLSDGGSIGLGLNQVIVIGGVTTNEIFVVAQFTTGGELDPTFGISRITYSSPIESLQSFVNLTVDSQNRVVVGGYIQSDITSVSMVVARFTMTGQLDTVLSTTGMGTTGTIQDLAFGGYVYTNIFDNIFVGGISMVSSLIVADLFSGQEHFVTDPSALTAEEYKIYWYGNSPDLFQKFLGVNLFARFITDPVVQDATITAVNFILDGYADVYAGQPGWNLVESTYRVSSEFDAAQEVLVTNYPRSADQINQFFQRFNTRRISFYINQPLS